jgi:hypothetical protein
MGNINWGNPNIRAMNRYLDTDENYQYQFSKQTSENKRFEWSESPFNHQLGSLRENGNALNFICINYRWRLVVCMLGLPQETGRSGKRISHDDCPHPQSCE